jgi:hypothetical protein
MIYIRIFTIKYRLHTLPDSAPHPQWKIMGVHLPYQTISAQLDILLTVYHYVSQ